MIGVRIIVNLYQDSRVYLGFSPSPRKLEPAHVFAELAGLLAGMGPWVALLLRLVILESITDT